MQALPLAGRVADRKSSRPRPLPHLAATVACALALSAGIAIAVFSGGFGLSPAGPEATGAAGPGTGAQAGNAFALVAYADENPSAEPGQAVAFALEDFGLESAWKVWNADPEVDPNAPDAGPGDGQRYLSVAYRFNLACAGTNVASLTYELEGDRVLFYTRTSRPRAKGEVDSVEERSKSFTVSYDEQRTDPARTWRALRASFPLEGELADLYDAVTGAFYSGTRDFDIEASDRLDLMALRRYADLVAQARITVTATFTDGSTQAKTYVIAPVDNLEEAMSAHTAALRAQAAAFDEDNPPTEAPEPPSPPQLFTLTELPEAAAIESATPADPATPPAP